jgi:hypothetical protein
MAQATEGGDYVLAPSLKLWRKRPKAEALGDLGAEEIEIPHLRYFI